MDLEKFAVTDELRAVANRTAVNESFAIFKEYSWSGTGTRRYIPGFSVLFDQ